MLIRERRYTQIENRMRDILMNTEKDVGVIIQADELINPLKNDFSDDELRYTIRHLAHKNYLDNQANYSILTLTMKGFDEWLFPFGSENSKKIFVSHADVDKDKAKKIKTALENPKFGFIVFLAHDDIPGSEMFYDKLISELYTSGIFIILRTKKYTGRPYTEQECGFAIALKKRILPLCIGTNPADMGFCSAVQGKKFNEWDEKKVIDYCIKQLVNSENIK